MNRMVFGAFSSRDQAEGALNTLENLGYNPKDISVVMRDEREAKEFADETGTDVAGGALSGATTGGVLGALAGFLVGTGVIPGLGALLIGGPLAAALGLTGVAAATVSGAATGVLAGGLVGALTGFGVSKEDAEAYEESVRRGGILLIVPATSGQEDEVRDVMAEYGATSVRAVDSSMEWEERRTVRDRDRAPMREDERHYGAMGYKGGEVKDEDEEEVVVPRDAKVRRKK